MKLYRQIILLTLTLLVLVSSTGVAVGMHICGGELRDVTLFGAAADCPMEQKQHKELPPCHAPNEKKNDDGSCCEDHQVVVERTDATSEHDTITLSKALDIKFVAAVQAVILQIFAPEAAVQPTYVSYASPPLARDIPVLVQAFLI